MEEQLRKLKTKRAMLLSQLEMLSAPSETFFAQLGKNTAEIHILEKQIVRSTENEI